MEKSTRNAIERATQKARKLLEAEFAEQLEGTFDILRDGHVGAGSSRMPAADQVRRASILAALNRKRANGMDAKQAHADYLRDAAFTTLNRFVALKMLEARELLQECITRGEQSNGYQEFTGMASGIALLPDGRGYRLYLESLFDELSTEIKVLFDRRDPATVLWPRRAAFAELLDVLNGRELAGIWAEDETIGWVYQYFNGADERKKMREESQAPRNSRELAVRNQFFTPRYVVQFLTDNTLGRTWMEMTGGRTRLTEQCEYFVKPVDEPLGHRVPKDPRDLKILDPACGSGHFLLYAFDLLLTIYEEAWALEGAPTSELTGRTLRADHPELAGLRAAAPGLIVEHNLYGVDIDARCAQIAALALWLRAQRAYRDLGIKPDARPRITRTHIVIAEPVPGDATMAAEFAKDLQPPFVATLFLRMVQEMRLAGELGTLLQVEKSLADDIRKARQQYLASEQQPIFPDLPTHNMQANLDLTGVTDESVFHDAEHQILMALIQFVTTASGSARRRLFVGDAGQGVAFGELVRTRFDVVLMNPPFGLPTSHGYDYIRTNFPGSHTDIYATFVTRAADLCPNGYIGALTSRSFFVTPRHESFRRTTILPSLQILLDLGLGVMDDALVESAAFITRPDNLSGSFLVSDVRVGRSVNPAGLKWEGRFAFRSVMRSDILALPQAKLLYALPPGLFASVSKYVPFEPSVGTARMGMNTFDNDRFLRLSWEVPLGTIGPKNRWKWFVKGGSHATYYSSLHLVLDWGNDGAAMKAVNEALNGSTAQVRQASDYWYRPGVTYSRRSSKGFSARCLPSGAIFSSNGPAVLPQAQVPSLTILGWINSRPVRALIHLQSNAGDYSAGAIKRLPWPRSWQPSEFLVDATARAVELLARRNARLETDAHFVVPSAVASRLAGFDDPDEEELEALLRQVTAEWDASVADAYALSEATWVDDVLSEVDDASPDDDVEDAEDGSLYGRREELVGLVSWCVGVAFGRFDVRYAIGERPLAPKPDPLGALPPLQPAMAARDGSEPGIAIAPVVRGFLVDDEGHPGDLHKAVQEVMQVALKEASERVWLETCESLSPAENDLRGWLRDHYFETHLRLYSRSRRRAPVYWQLGPQSGRYSVWCYAHAMTKDSLLTLSRDILQPKVAYEERRLAQLSTDAGIAPSAKQAAAVAVQNTYVEELRSFLREVRRVAPLWNPDLDDGIVLVMAPLWRLVPGHRAWQKELRTKWDELCAGKYDWAHLSMHLWPERVVPKCATDRSLAIAHGLEDVFWVEGDDGKWTKRAKPTRAIEDLVAERTSPAVKAALASLLEAPAPAGGAKGRRKAG